MSVTTKAEAGLRGYHAQLARYGQRQVNAWRRKGGRRPNPTWDQIQAGTEPQRARSTSQRR